MSGDAPIIGLNCDTFRDDSGAITGVRDAYWEAIERAGGIPLLIPHLTDRAALHGSELHQHLPDELPGIKHMLDRREATATHHALQIDAGSLLSKIWDGALAAEVNSSHHQGVKDPGNGLRVAARASDGLVEAL